MPAPTTTPDRRRFSLDLPRGRRLDLEAGRPRILGIVNITPDSFSDGGRFLEPARAVEHGLRLLAEGADLLDLGAESTRPGGGGTYGDGAAEVPVEEELSRLLPVLERLRAATDAPLSVDTRKAAVAERALAAGADLVNDIRALRDPEMRRVVARAGCPAILMHSRGELATMQREIAFDDLLTDVLRELAAALRAATADGVAHRQLLVDPGIGFGKTAAQSTRLVGALARFAELDAPVVLGASRKSFLSGITGAAVGERLAGSLAVAAWGADAGASLLRVHDVRETRQVLDVWQALAAARRESR